MKDVAALRTLPTARATSGGSGGGGAGIIEFDADVLAHGLDTDGEEFFVRVVSTAETRSVLVCDTETVPITVRDCLDRESDRDCETELPFVSESDASSKRFFDTVELTVRRTEGAEAL